MKLKEIRIKKGMSQGDVAKKLDCSANVYARYERGERQPSVETLIKLSDIFDVSVDFIIGNPEPQMLRLSKYEMELVKEARGADERAREDALILFRAHKTI